MKPKDAKVLKEVRQKVGTLFIPKKSLLDIQDILSKTGRKDLAKIFEKRK